MLFKYSVKTALALVSLSCAIVLLTSCKLFKRESASTSASSHGGEATLFRAGNRYGGEAPDHYFDTIQPIIGSRCTVCHGCENAPCSLKLVSYHGLIRGGTKVGNYSPNIQAIKPLRLKDGPLQGTEEEWKKAWQVSRPVKERFNAIAPEAGQEGDEALNSLLYLFLKQGNENNQPGFDRAKVRKLEQERYDLGATVCVANTSEYGNWKAENPEGGMPFGCPGLKRASEGGYAAGEFDTLETWIKKGAPGPDSTASANHAKPTSPETIARWEDYLNEPTDKQRLVSRFLYEHLFRARIHFETSPGEFFEIVRASNPPGDYPVAEIVTAAPNDAPGQEARPVFFYRLRKMTDLITIKDHLVWQADDRVLERIKFLFEKEKPHWSVSALSGYESKNPFLYFQAIPPSIRYKFLLDNAKYIVENLVRSPVCNGTLATFAMDDYQWIMHIHPESDPTAQDSGPAAFGTEDWAIINDGYNVNTNYIRGQYSLIKHNEEYLTRLERRLRVLRPNGMRLEDIWDGSCLFHAPTCPQGKNSNAWLSAIRHETNGTVVFGGEGGNPNSIFLYNFSNVERAYYSLSFNYREWEGVQHKLLSWRDFMHVRIESQDRFLSLFPQNYRTAIRHDWSSGFLGEIGVAIFPDRSLGKERGWEEVKKAFLRALPGNYFEENLLVGVRPGDPAISLPDGITPREAFLRVLRKVQVKRFSTHPNRVSTLNSETKAAVDPSKVDTREDLEAIINGITQRNGFFNSRLPSVSYVRIVPQNWIYSIIVHRRYAARNFMTDAFWARRGQSALDTTSVYRGIMGDYPNIFFEMTLVDAASFFKNLVQIKTDDEWLKLRRRYMVPKNSDNFWQTVDFYHAWMGKNMPVSGGIIDLREYDNWEIPPESQGK